MPSQINSVKHRPAVLTGIVSLCAIALFLTGIAIAPPPEPASGASWIWHPDRLSSPNTRVYLATAVEIPTDVAKATLTCTADNEYVFFINGHGAGRTPGDGASGDWWRSFDRTDATNLVNSGWNVLAVEAYNVSGPAGFIARLEVELTSGEKLSFVTDESWSSATEKPDGWPVSPTLPFGKAARSLGQPPVTPWGRIAAPSPFGAIIARSRPELRREMILPKTVLEIQGRSDGVKEVQKVLHADGRAAEINLPEGETASIVLDFGREVVGYFRTQTSGGSATLDLAYGESLRECLQANPFQPVERRTAQAPEWKWIDTERHAFRYLKVTMSECKSPLLVDYFGLDSVGYPVENKGGFRCSDDVLNRIWEVGRYTTRLCMQDHYEDGIKRDRRLWIGDLRIEALSGYYAFGDYDLARLDLLRTARIQLADGSIPAVGPGPSSLILPDYCAYWVSTLWEYYMHSGDRALVELLYPNVQRQMQWFTRQLDRNSLIRDADRGSWWCFIDWADIDKRDQVTALESIYYHALMSAAEIARLVGDAEGAAEHPARAKRVKRSVNKLLWLEDDGAYADCRTASEISSRITQQTNALAVLFGVAGPDRWDSIHRAVFDQKTVPPTTTPYMNFYVTKALFRTHRDQDALDLIRDYWGGMLARGATTYWEIYDPRKPADFVPDSDMSFCHGWSAGVTSILPAEVVGIKPGAPGFREVAIVPHLADLDWAEARVPTPHGDVFVSWKRQRPLVGGISKSRSHNSNRRSESPPTSAGLTGTIELPRKSSAVIGVPGDPSRMRVRLDSQTVWQDGKPVSPRPAGVTGIWTDGRYVFLKLGRGGNFTVSAD